MPSPEAVSAAVSTAPSRRERDYEDVLTQLAACGVIDAARTPNHWVEIEAQRESPDSWAWEPVFPARSQRAESELLREPLHSAKGPPSV